MNHNSDYKKLKALCEGLELENITQLMCQSVNHFKNIGGYY